MIVTVQPKGGRGSPFGGVARFRSAALALVTAFDDPHAGRREPVKRQSQLQRYSNRPPLVMPNQSWINQPDVLEPQKQLTATGSFVLTDSPASVTYLVLGPGQALTDGRNRDEVFNRNLRRHRRVGAPRSASAALEGWRRPARLVEQALEVDELVNAGRVRGGLQGVVPWSVRRGAAPGPGSGCGEPRGVTARRSRSRARQRVRPRDSCGHRAPGCTALPPTSERTQP